MHQQISWYEKVLAIVQRVKAVLITRRCEIVDIYQCQETGSTKALVKLSRQQVVQKNVRDIVMDNDFIEALDKKTIRTLTYMAAMEKVTPDYFMVIQQISHEIDEYLLEIKSRNGKFSIKKSPSEISKDKSLVSKLSPVEANRIGYLAGVRETVREYQLLNKKKK